jgi:hypothetical protein
MARDFDGVDDRYTRSTLHSGGVPPATLACWFKLTDTAQDLQTLLSFYNSDFGPQQLSLLWTTVFGGFLAAETRNSAGNSRATIALANTSWHHGAAVFAASNDRRVFLDASKATNTVDRGATGMFNLAIGCTFNAATAERFADAVIAEVGAWDVALTDQEIRSLASGMAPFRVRPLSLLAYYPLFGPSPTIDYSGKGNTLTESGTIAADHAPVGPMFGFDLPPVFRSVPAGLLAPALRSRSVIEVPA